MKKDGVANLYKNVFGLEIEKNLNKIVKAVILDFKDKEIIVKNDNFGTRRKYLDFINGRKEAGLNPLQIVFAGIQCEAAVNSKFIGSDEKIHSFSELI